MSLRLRKGTKPTALDSYRSQMHAVMHRVESARLQIAESRSIEELDLGRSALQASFAEMQRIIRLAKEASGVPVRPVEEVEAAYQELLDRLAGREAPPDLQ